jgi:hypothetical protein
MHNALRYYFVVLLLAVSPVCNSQTITSLFVDFPVSQGIEIDTAISGIPAHYKSASTEKDFAIGIRLFEVNPKRKIHFGFNFTYHRVNLKSLGLTYNTQPTLYEKQDLFEILFGATYFSPKPLISGKKIATHVLMNGTAGFCRDKFGANLSAGLIFLNMEGVSGLSFEFIYRPVGYAVPNKSASFTPDPYYVNIEPSYGLRMALNFGRYLEYIEK